MTAPTVDPKAAAGATLRTVAGDLLTRARGATSRRAVADRLGVSDVNLLELELGRGNPTLNRLAGVAVDYGINLRLVDVDMIAELRFALERRLAEAPDRPAAARHRLAGAIAALDLVDAATAAPASQAPEWADVSAVNLASQPQHTPGAP